MIIIFDTTNILVALAGIANLLYGLIVYSRGRSQAGNRAFFFFAVSVAIWSITMVYFRSLKLESEALIAARVLYLAASLIPLAFLYFAIVFEHREKKSISNWWFYAAIVPPVITAVLSLLPNGLIQNVVIGAGEETIINFNPVLHPWYLAYITAYALFVFGILARRYKLATKDSRTRLFYILVGTSVPWAVSLFTNLLLPFLGIFTYNWVGQISTFFSTTIITYGIFRHHLFDARVLLAELLMFTLWVIALTRIVISDSVAAATFNSGVFVLLIIVGLLLVRSVYNEVKAREEIERLAEHLEDANVRLKELDRQKSEFLSMAAHQLRTPLTSIKGYASLMLEGSYGDLPDKVDGVLETIFASSSRMVDTVSDFLNVSRIEQGKMEYRMVDTDLGNLAKSVVTELALSAKEKGLELNFHDDGRGPYPIHADVSKIEHVVSNLVDNAIKYTPKGAVSVRVEKDSTRNIGIVKVIDTGAGIPKEALPKLFDKFVRARNAHEINVTGTGLGLYVAREMMDKHDGKIWAESKGEGKGSTFFVEIPLKKGSD
jgi:signal transduction histidine kinase